MNDIKLEDINLSGVNAPKQPAQNAGFTEMEFTPNEPTTPAVSTGGDFFATLDESAIGGDFEPLEPGIYAGAIIEDVEAKDTTWGDRQISITVGLENGRKHWINLTYAGANLSAAKFGMNIGIAKQAILNTTGVDVSFTGKDANFLLSELQKIIGRNCKLQIKHVKTDKNDKGYFVNEAILKA